MDGAEVAATRGTVVGRVGLERRAVRIDDVLTDAEYEWHEAINLSSTRSMVGVPMLAAERVVGVIVLQRTELAPFDDRTVGVLTTLAAQGALAIQNVQLFRALQQREHDLAASVGELRALGEISQAVSSSLDVDHVLRRSSPARWSCPGRRAVPSSISTRRHGCSNCARATGRSRMSPTACATPASTWTRPFSGAAR